jgi:RHS repeat-associated protein
MRISVTGGSNTVYYILKDHLGSASVVTSDSGAPLGEQRYYPYGETRLTTGTIYTDKLFTGQRDTGLGIYHYGARFYSPKIGRFISPDTIIPGYGNPQNLNRFSYVRNNPVRYTDPTGHMIPCEPGDVCQHPDPPPPPPPDPDPEPDPDPTPDPNPTPSPTPTPMPNPGPVPAPYQNTDYYQLIANNLYTNPIESYCGDISGLACLANLAQDTATLVDLVGVGLIETPAVIAGCFEGGPLGCAIAEVGVIATWNVTLNNVEWSASTLSLGLTIADDVFNNGGWGENSSTSLVAWVAGTMPLTPSWDLAVDIYASGYNHGFFNGVNTISTDGVFK